MKRFNSFYYKKELFKTSICLIIYWVSFLSCEKNNQIANTPSATSLGTFSYSTPNAIFFSDSTEGSSVEPVYVGSGSSGVYSTDSILPTGIILHAQTGVLSWKGAISPGVYVLRIKNTTAEKIVIYTLTVLERIKSPSFLYSVSSSTYVSGASSSQSVSPTFLNGLAGEYSTNSILPTGVVLNSKTGVLSWSGIIAPGTYLINIKNSNSTQVVLYTLTVIINTPSVVGKTELPLDFETSLDTIVNFSGGEGILVENPNKSLNNSLQVFKIVKKTGQIWGGVWTKTKSPIDFSTKKGIKVDVYSPRIGATLLLKFENETNQNTFMEVKATTTKSNAWETLEFDFSTFNLTNSYSKIIFIFDYGTIGDGSSNYTFYIDNVTQFTIPTNTIDPTTITGTKLIWSDEFDVEGMPNSTKWTYDIGTGPNGDGWGNNELQYYTNRQENVYVKDGLLKITLKKESYNGRNYTSARLLTQGKFSVKYGKIEAKIKVPVGIGTWPAFWMLGTNISSVGWPNCGEIDIMEYAGKDLNKIYGTLHYPGRSGGNPNGSTTMITNATTEFHIYTVEWFPNKITIFVDGKSYFTFDNNYTTVFNTPFFMLLNVAMGGAFGGGVDPNFVSATMEVDYVRVYQ